MQDISNCGISCISKMVTQGVLTCFLVRVPSLQPSRHKFSSRRKFSRETKKPTRRLGKDLAELQL